MLKDYGWAAAIFLFIAREIWPQAFSVFAKTHQKKVDAQMAALKSKQDGEIEAAKAEREERAAERMFRHGLDERQVKAYEELVKSNQLQVQLLITMNERMNTLNTAQNNLTRFLTDAISEMRGTIAGKQKDQEKHE